MPPAGPRPRAGPCVQCAAVHDPGRLDALDAAIFSLLQSDGRLPYTAIARELDVPEGTVRFRVNRLVREEIIRVTALIHPQPLGGVLATLLVRVEARRRAHVVQHLAGLDAVMYLSATAGRTQLMLQTVVADLDALHGLVSEELDTIDGVLEVETLIELEVHKARQRFPELA
jgi:Lrp/AsnC family transcriptional regulator for asnA, asnC and gidA